MNIQEALNFLENRHNVIGEEGTFEGEYSKYSISFLTKGKEPFGYDERTHTVYGISTPTETEEYYNQEDLSLTFDDGSYNEENQEITIN